MLTVCEYIVLLCVHSTGTHSEYEYTYILTCKYVYVISLCTCVSCVHECARVLMYCIFNSLFSDLRLSTYSTVSGCYGAGP